MLRDLADEAHPLASESADEPLGCTVIAERPADRVDPRGQGRFGNDAAAPYPLQQIVLGDDAFPVLHEKDQQVEGLGFEVDHIAAAAQLAALDIEPVVAKC